MNKLNTATMKNETTSSVCAFNQFINENIIIRINLIRKEKKVLKKIQCNQDFELHMFRVWQKIGVSTTLHRHIN